ncbi:MFS transporter [Deinococcus yunweiensis]|uniref:MFS transporter n=1 Tax=Deinococcus yunweiensis TaxID=367282 RepID=UPI00398F05DB
MRDAASRAHPAAWSLFAVNGVLYGSWIVQIPAQQARWTLSTGELGVLLSVLALGTVVAKPAVTALLGRWGLRGCTGLAAITMMAALAAVALAPSVPLTAAALLVYGSGFGGVDLLMNITGAWIETRRGQPVLSGLHGAFSAGVLVAAGLGAAALQAGLDARWLLVGLTGVSALVAAWAVPRLPDSVHAAGALDAPRPALSATVVRLMGLAVCAAFVEGLCIDWGAAYLVGTQRATLAQGAAGYAAFAGSMVVTRFAGDGLTRRLGPDRLAVVAGTVLLAGLSLATLRVSVPVTQAALLLCGVGVAVLAPLTFSAAGRAPHAAVMAWVSTAFLAGFLIAPGVTGAVTQLGSLALAFVPGMVLTVIVLALRRTLAAGRPAGEVSPLTGP